MKRLPRRKKINVTGKIYYAPRNDVILDCRGEIKSTLKTVIARSQTKLTSEKDQNSDEAIFCYGGGHIMKRLPWRKKINVTEKIYYAPRNDVILDCHRGIKSYQPSTL